MMTPQMFSKVRASLIKHESLEQFPYRDSLDNITIGIGYNLTARGLPLSWINQQFSDDANYFYDQLTTNFTWFQKLTMSRQIVLIDMAFMGWKHFLTFNKMLAALAEFDYDLASDEMLRSKWAMQVKGRAHELANAMRTGSYDV